MSIFFYFGRVQTAELPGNFGLMDASKAVAFRRLYSIFSNLDKALTCYGNG